MAIPKHWRNLADLLGESAEQTLARYRKLCDALGIYGRYVPQAGVWKMCKVCGGNGDCIILRLEIGTEALAAGLLDGSLAEQFAKMEVEATQAAS